MRKYKYVFFDAGIPNGNGVDETNYFYISTSELRNDPGITMVYYPLDYAPSVIRKACSATLIVSSKFPALKHIRKIWYPYFFKGKLKKEENVCFLVYGYYAYPDYLRYLRKKYPYCKIVKIHRDDYLKWKDRNKEFTDKDVDDLFDAHFTFDLGDSKKYGFVHFDEIASRFDKVKIELEPIHDVFFAGAAKDRLNTIKMVYDYLTDKGLNCFFYITGAKATEIDDRNGILYAEKTMAYTDMLYHSVNSRIILEINQQNVDGYTSRFLESVMYNKRLITNNFSVKLNQYYNPKYICCFEKVEDISEQFLHNEVLVDYHYNGEFSPKHLIDSIDKYLSSK